jgi:hypothetical protein
MKKNWPILLNQMWRSGNFMSYQILLVEGDADEGLFTAICQKAGLGVKVTVGKPAKFGGEGSGKGNTLHLLPTLIEQMRDGQISQLAMVIDADFIESDGLGFRSTLEKVAVILKEYDYKVGASLKSRPGGYCFKHSDGLPNFGLWIMPNNGADGLLEDFIKDSISANQKDLFKKATDAVGALQTPLFRPIHRSKADVATWMAWQKIPGQALRGVVGGELVDFTSGNAKQLMDWLQSIYS